MLYTELTIKAMRLAYEAHKEQNGKTGMPYISHPYHLAEEMTNEGTTATTLQKERHIEALVLLGYEK
jgi:(p)ppGpp synthase/HD superfamily hydrolase